MKHVLPLLPRQGRSVFATLSAKVGSIGDNHLGGWYSYRASKAALNQILRTAAIEARRDASPRRSASRCIPGTVDTGLSEPFARTGLSVQSPEEARGPPALGDRGAGAGRYGLVLRLFGRAPALVRGRRLSRGPFRREDAGG